MHRLGSHARGHLLILTPIRPSIVNNSLLYSVPRFQRMHAEIVCEVNGEALKAALIKAAEQTAENASNGTGLEKFDEDTKLLFDSGITTFMSTRYIDGCVSFVSFT